MPSMDQGVIRDSRSKSRGMLKGGSGGIRPGASYAQKAGQVHRSGGDN